jgi:hypothetical protein
MRQMDDTEQATIESPEKKSSRERREAGAVPRWAALIGVLAIGVIYAVLPERLTVGPNWLLLVIEAAFLLPIIIGWLTDHHLPHKLIRMMILTLLGIITLALVAGLVLFVGTLPERKAPILLQAAGLLWAFNILLFALWYWELDGGGPIERHEAGHQAADFQFPQQVNGNKSGWAPHFLDYLFLAFNTSTALSPTDTYPLTRTAKALMMIQAVISLIVIVLLAARAVNILGS